uniref:Uncharacterized protein n=1 Tax=Medicago truncatula TaxID=3880 RepID=A2Q367_MEDTR|nr:hypothetical protein MtrDRAFT_AC154867g37v2 [Medicago truncatula]
MDSVSQCFSKTKHPFIPRTHVLIFKVFSKEKHRTMESTKRFGGFSKTRRKDKDFAESTIKLCK